MWISQVELHNIKSYGARTTIELAPGINAVCGQNGAGKSTILEAIGLALFGQSTYKNQEQLINAKAKRGEIVVTVVDSRDEREYQVVRPLKGGPPYVFDSETNRQLASGVDDVQRWLRDTIGVESTTDLKALFENAVGVPQGMLTSAFNLTGANRQKIFDPLLGVEEYKEVWDEMRAVVSQIKDQQSSNATAQARLAGKLEELPSLRNDAASLLTCIETTETELRQTTVSLAELCANLTALQQQYEALKALEQRAASLAERRDNLASQLQSAVAALTEARQANKIVEQNRAGYQTHQEAQQTQQSLEADRKKRDDIQRQLNQCQNALDLAEHTLKALEQQLVAVAQAEARLIELEPLVAQQSALEAQRQAAAQCVAELQVAQQRLTEETQRLAGLQAEREHVQGQLSQRQEKTELISERQQQAGALASGIAAQDESLTKLERQLEATRQSLQVAQGRLNTLQLLEKQVEENEQLLAQRQTELADVVVDLAQCQELEESLAAIQQTRLQRKNELAAIEAQFGEQEAAREQVHQSLSDWQAQAQTLTNLRGNIAALQRRLTEAEAELNRLADGLTERQQLNAQLIAWETEQVTANEQREALMLTSDRLDTRLTDIASALVNLDIEAETPCPTCRKPLSAHDLNDLKNHYEAEQIALQTERQTVDETFKQIDKTLKQLKRQLKQGQADLEKLPTPVQLERQQKTVSDYHADLSRDQQQADSLAETPVQVTRLKQQMQQLDADIGTLKEQRQAQQKADADDEAEQTRLQQALSQLARPADQLRLQTDIEQLHASLTRQRTEAVSLSDVPAQVTAIQTKLDGLEAQKVELQQQRRQLNDARDALGQEISVLQTAISQLAAPGRLTELDAALAAQQTTRDEWQSKVEALAVAPAEREAAEQALVKLGNPRREQQAAQLEADKRPALSAEQIKKQADCEDLLAQKNAIEAELEPFAGLDDAFNRVIATLEESRVAHQTYLEQRITADTLPQREKAVETIRQQVAAVTTTVEKVQAELAQASAAYDADQHEQTRQEEQNARTREIQLATELKGQQQQLADKQSKIAGLEAIAIELETLKAEGDRLLELQQVTEFIRRTIREAGPEITRQLVNAVSLRADAIFADLMDDHQQTLAWDESYAISVRRDGYDRDFQQLSGGEAMSAALAVRLALLQSMSAVDVAFFDEPTANLDPERRASLAEQIARIKGFSQLVVISHDDTFEQDVGHVIHIGRNDKGESQVVA
ncbi:MAG: Chromosome partition protein Smc [Anaerolineae bacterium]|nr:Chromosome partition protein Smc [Anaerolineae bacterium]